MAVIYNSGGGGCAFSSDCTATADNIMANRTAIYVGTDNEAANGTLPLTSVKVENGGLLAINSTLSF